MCTVFPEAVSGWAESLQDQAGQARSDARFVKEQDDGE